MRDRFYLACFRDNVGENVAFHAIGDYGYTTDVDKAKVYTRERAQRAWDMAREFDHPVSSGHVDSMSVWKVDMQYIPNDTTIDKAAGKFVGYQSRRYNGNDVFWLTKKLPNTDFSQAAILGFEDVDANDDSIVYLPFGVADKAKRRTFDFSKLNKRTMTQGAGLVTPDRIKRENRRKRDPKIRMNCPSCGKINWQRHPYDFVGCIDVLCSEHRLGDQYE